MEPWTTQAQGVDLKSNRHPSSHSVPAELNHILALGLGGAQITGRLGSPEFDGWSRPAQRKRKKRARKSCRASSRLGSIGSWRRSRSPTDPNVPGTVSPVRTSSDVNLSECHALELTCLGSFVATTQRIFHQTKTRDQIYIQCLLCNSTIGSGSSTSLLQWVRLSLNG